MSPIVVLVGMPGTGKSSSGRRLAKILGVRFADTDDLVQAADGRRVAQIFATVGESAFRALETAALEQALDDFDGVLALGGGAIVSARNRSAIAASQVPVVHLRAAVEVLTTRVGDARTRPLLQGGPQARLTALAAERDPLYAGLATFAVDTDDRTPGQVAATVAARLHARGALVRAAL